MEAQKLNPEMAKKLGHAYKDYLLDLREHDLGATRLDQRLRDLLGIITTFGGVNLGADESLVCLDEALTILEDRYDEWRESHTQEPRAHLVDHYFSLATDVVDDFFIDEDENPDSWFTERYLTLTKIEDAIEHDNFSEAEEATVWSGFLRMVVDLMRLIQRDKAAEAKWSDDEISRFFAA